MALISTIRSKGTLILVLMIVAIVGFLAMDIFQSKGMGGASPNVLGKVAGKELTMQELQAAQEVYPNNSQDPYGVREGVWSGFVDNAVVTQETEALGMGVSKDELRDLEFGQNLSPIIQGLMQSGQISQDLLKQIKQAVEAKTPVDPGFAARWNEYEKLIIKEKLQSKLVNFVSKGIYTPNWMAEQATAELGQPIDFEYVKVNFDAVADSLVKVEDADITQYIKDHAARYTNEEETRRLDYVVYTVTPSAADTAKIQEQLMKQVNNGEGFAATKNDSAFVAINNGVFNDAFFKKEQISQNKEVTDRIFAQPVGTVTAPYADQKYLVVAKIIDRRSSPDSVHSRHILVKTQSLADSIKMLVETGRGAWDSLNVQFNEDKNAAANRGDLGTVPQGAMVPQFNDQIFFKSQIGKTYVVQTRFGFHVVQVLNFVNGKNEQYVKAAFLRQPIIPSDATVKAVTEAANDFVTKNRTAEAFKKAAQEKGMPVQTTQPLKKNDYRIGNAGGGDGGHQLTRWAFDEGKIGEVAPTTYGFKDQGDIYTSRYVAAAFKSIQEKGLSKVEYLREELTPVVRNKKKAAMLVQKITETDLPTIAQKYSSKVDTAKNVTFNAQFVPGIGSEALVLATAFTSAVNTVSKPIGGDNGVFVLKVTNKPTNAPNIADANTMKMQLAQGMRSQVRGTITQALRKKASIVDNRASIMR